MKLSVIIPVYNEVHTLDRILIKVVEALPKINKEIIIVDDGSTDGTREWLTRTFQCRDSYPVYINLNSDRQLVIKDTTVEEPLKTSATLKVDKSYFSAAVKIIFHETNQGKGAALRTGFAVSQGDVLVIQDADLEYDPQDWQSMWQLIEEGYADVVYGSRFYGKPHRVLYFHHYLGNKVITNLLNLLCNTTFTDIEVCYKMFRNDVIENLLLTCNDFGFEVEFTVKVSCSRRRWRLYETGVSYYGRAYEEGKKINWRDGLKALGYILRFRLFH